MLNNSWAQSPSICRLSYYIHDHLLYRDVFSFVFTCFCFLCSIGNNKKTGNNQDFPQQKNRSRRYAKFAKWSINQISKIVMIKFVSTVRTRKIVLCKVMQSQKDKYICSLIWGYYLLNKYYL